VVAEWSCSGLQSRVQRFDSAPRLHAKPAEKPYKLFDQRGLYLLVTAAGDRLWGLRYRIGGVENLLAFGSYPDVSLKGARERRDDARRLIADGIDPSAERQAEKRAGADTFEAVAREYLDRQQTKLSAKTNEIYLDRLERLVLPYLGSRPIASITAPDVLAVLRRIEVRGTHETAHRVRSLCAQKWFSSGARRKRNDDATVARQRAEAARPLTPRNRRGDAGASGGCLTCTDLLKPPSSLVLFANRQVECRRDFDAREPFDRLEGGPDALLEPGIAIGETAQPQIDAIADLFRGLE
jgi:hypothetical protein